MEHSDFYDWERAAEAEIADAWREMSGDEAPLPEPSDTTIGEVMDEPLTVTVDGEQVEARDPRLVRLLTLELLMDFLWADGPNPLRAFHRLFHLTFNVSPKRLYHMNQTRLARILNQTRAAFSAEDKRVWEQFLKEKGFFGSRTSGKKNDDARARYSREKKGNHCRKGGHRFTRKITVLRKQTNETP